MGARVRHLLGDDRKNKATTPLPQIQVKAFILGMTTVRAIRVSLKNNNNNKKHLLEYNFCEKNNNYILVHVRLCVHYVPGNLHASFLQAACEVVIIFTPF